MEELKIQVSDHIKNNIEVFPRNTSTIINKDVKDEPTPALKNEEMAQNIKQVEEVKKEKINRIAESLDNYIQSMRRDLKIKVHEKTGNIIVEVQSQDSKKIIREIPPKELLDLAARIEELAGLLFDEKV